jgi:hypothetical protein
MFRKSPEGVKCKEAPNSQALLITKLICPELSEVPCIHRSAEQADGADIADSAYKDPEGENAGFLAALTEPAGNLPSRPPKRERHCHRWTWKIGARARSAKRHPCRFRQWVKRIIL